MPFLLRTSSNLAAFILRRTTSGLSGLQVLPISSKVMRNFLRWVISWLRQHTYCHVIRFFCHFYHAESSEPATPHYNSTVLGDHLPLSHLQFLSAISAQCPAFGEGVALLKVWLRQRELDQVRPHYFCMHMSFITYIDIKVVTWIE